MATIKWPVDPPFINRNWPLPPMTPGHASALSEDALTTISLAVKAIAALCRGGMETVRIDGEAIDLWDLKRDLRALLGPDGD